MKNSGPTHQFKLGSNSAFLRSFLSRHLPAVALATTCALLLGVVSTAVVSLIGPCVQLLLAAEEKTSFHLSEFFGSRSSGLFHSLLPEGVFSRDELFVALPLALFCLASCKAVFYISQNIVWERLGEILGRDLRLGLVAAYIELDPSVRGDAEAIQQEGELASLVATDVKMLRDYVVHFYGGLPRELLQIVFMGATLVALSPKLSALFTLGLAPAGVVISRLGKKLRRRAAAALDNYSELTEWLQGRLLGVETIKHYHTETIEVRKFTQLTAMLYQKFLHAARIKARTSPFLEAIALCSLVMVLVCALGEVRAGKLNGSTAISFFTALALMCQSIAIVGRYLNSNREGAAAADRVRRALQFFAAQRYPQLRYSGERFEDPELVLECRDLTALYPGKAPVLGGFSYRFYRGKIYAIVGPSGVGKSTLSRLILGLQRPSEGQVLFKQELLERFPLPIAYVPQKIQLLDGSIAENIAYPQPAADEQGVWQALKEVGLEDFARGLAEGIHTRVGERGYGLSGGQEQRIYLARLGYQEFPLALIDEGTSALDLMTEEKVIRYLEGLRARGMCILFITHRTSIMRSADAVITLA